MRVRYIDRVRRQTGDDGADGAGERGEGSEGRRLKERAHAPTANRTQDE